MNVKEIWAKVWPYLKATLTLMPKFLLKTGAGRAIIAWALVKVGIKIDQSMLDEICKYISFGLLDASDMANAALATSLAVTKPVVPMIKEHFKGQQ